MLLFLQFFVTGEGRGEVESNVVVGGVVVVQVVVVVVLEGPC